MVADPIGEAERMLSWASVVGLSGATAISVIVFAFTHDVAASTNQSSSAESRKTPSNAQPKSKYGTPESVRPQRRCSLTVRCSQLRWLDSIVLAGRGVSRYAAKPACEALTRTMAEQHARHRDTHLLFQGRPGGIHFPAVVGSMLVPEVVDLFLLIAPELLELRLERDLGL